MLQQEYDLIPVFLHPRPTPFIAKSSLTYDSPEDSLQPDPGSEQDFDVPNNPFAFSPGQLNKLLKP